MVLQSRKVALAHGRVDELFFKIFISLCSRALAGFLHGYGFIKPAIGAVKVQSLPRWLKLAEQMVFVSRS